MLDRSGERFDVVGTGQRIDRLRHTGLLRQNLLRAQRHAGGLFAGQRQRLIVAVDVQRLGAAENGGERLQGGAGEVVLGLLRGQRRAGGLSMKAQRLGERFAGAELLPQQARPYPARGTKLGHLLEEVIVRGKKEGEARRCQIHIEARGAQRFQVGAPIGQSEGHLLHGGGPGLAHVITGDGDRVPCRQIFGGPGEQVGNQAQAVPQGVDVGAARDVLLQDVILYRARELIYLCPGTPGRRDIQGEQECSPWH